MSLDHDFLVGFSKSFGLFYLLALSAAVLVYTF
jgi:cytochrome c oxidase cbb3-type subunit IV